MRKNEFTAEALLDLACTTFGLEDQHTIAIAKIAEVKKGGYLEPDYADSLAQLLYNDGALLWGLQEEADEPLEYVGDPDEPWDEDEGFDPYMGCYTGDC